MALTRADIVRAYLKTGLKPVTGIFSSWGPGQRRKACPVGALLIAGGNYQTWNVAEAARLLDLPERTVWEFIFGADCVEGPNHSLYDRCRDCPWFRLGLDVGNAIRAGTLLQTERSR